ncbi:MAG: hypothetical protein ACJ8F7_20895 [Gemmataceae bacterium]
MDEYICITVLSNPGEAQADFAARLSRFWTQMLRTRKADFERVYAETTAFEPHGDRLSRRYLAEAGVREVLERELAAAGVKFEPVDADDLYSKYEAVPPEWMWIEH